MRVSVHMERWNRDLDKRISRLNIIGLPVPTQVAKVPFAPFRSFIFSNRQSIVMMMLSIIIRTFLLGNVAAAIPSDPRSNHPNIIHSMESLSVFGENRSALANTTVLSSTLRDWRPIISCSGQRYRQDLAVNSCRNAVKKIPRDSKDLLFGLRIGQKYNVALPARFISSEC